MTSTDLLPILAGGGAVAGLSTLLGAWWQRRRYRADARLVEAQALATEEETKDAHWERQVRILTGHIIEPLRAEVGGLRAEVRQLRAEVDVVRTRYWRAITHIRTLVAWAGAFGHSSEELPPPPPEISADI